MFLSAIQQWVPNLALQECELLEPDTWRQVAKMKLIAWGIYRNTYQADCN